MGMVFHLVSRCVMEVKGPDAANFLQNIFTNDIAALSDDKPLQYSLLLSPQGQVLHEVFVLRQSNDVYLVDIWQARKADILRRLQIFRLRAKVDIIDTDIKVYAGRIISGADDPRSNLLGKRFYTKETLSADNESGYHDFCILNGVATPQAIRFEKDFTHDLGLDKLNAIAWSKGCFIGQEVAARVEHRGLAKKGLFTVSATQNIPCDGVITLDDGSEVGEIRDISSDRLHALAVIKKIALQNSTVLKVSGVEITLKNQF